MVKASSLLFVERNYLLFISTTWIILVIAINPYGEFPYNDDWAYAHSVKALIESGKFSMSAWTAVNLFVQIGWGALFCLPFGFSFTALRLSTLVAGLFGLWGTHRLVYNSTENQNIAIVGTLMMLVNPMYVGLSASFMTDVPFYAVVVWSLSFLITGLKQDSWRLLLPGLFLAVIALLIRQFGIALFAGFGLAYIARKGINLKSIGIACLSGIAGVGIQIGYQRWLLYMAPEIVSYNVQASNFFHLSYYKLALLHGFLNNTFVGLLYTGLFMFPYFLTLLNKHSLAVFRKNIGLWILVGTVTIAVWQIFFDGMNMPIWFNTLNAYGLGPLLLRDLYFRLYTLPLPATLHSTMTVVTVISLIGSTVILYFLIKIIYYLLNWSADFSQKATAILLFSFLGVYFFPIGLQVVFDRYLLPIAVLLLILIHLIQSDGNRKKVEHSLRLPLFLSTSLLGLYLIFGVCATHDYLAWNRVRWQLLNNLVRQGIKVTEIDGGFEFNGWYLYSSSYKSTPTKSWWWVYDDTYVVGASVLPGYALYQKHEVDTWFPWGIRQIIIGKKSQPGDVTRLTNPYSTNL